jgi:hypothetical protein
MILSRKNKKADKFIQELLDKNAEYIDWQSLITKDITIIIKIY